MLYCKYEMNHCINYKNPLTHMYFVDVFVDSEDGLYEDLDSCPNYNEPRYCHDLQRTKIPQMVLHLQLIFHIVWHTFITWKWM
jgi:hypothetical protein